MHVYGLLAGGGALSGGAPWPEGAVALARATRGASGSIDQNLARLAEIMGGLAWLRPLCGAGDAAAWRERVAALMAAESATPERRERIAGAYNAGYKAYSYTYKRCTASAELAIQRYLAEGAELTRNLAARAAR